MKVNHDIIAAIFDTRDAKPWRYHEPYSMSAFPTADNCGYGEISPAHFFNATLAPVFRRRVYGVLEWQIEEAGDPQGAMIVVRVYYLPAFDASRTHLALCRC